MSHDNMCTHVKQIQSFLLRIYHETDDLINNDLLKACLPYENIYISVNLKLFKLSLYQSSFIYFYTIDLCQVILIIY